MYQQLQQALLKLQQTMQQHALWQHLPPSESAFQSQQPFALDTMSPTEWLQWIFIPRMQALIEAKAPLPQQIAISPYLEEALKEEQYLVALLENIRSIEQLLRSC